MHKNEELEAKTIIVTENQGDFSVTMHSNVSVLLLANSESEDDCLLVDFSRTEDR